MSRPVGWDWKMELAKHTVLCCLLITVFLPFYLMVVISLKDNSQMLQNLWIPTPPYHWENYAKAWEYVAPYIFNTVIVAVASMCGTMFVASLSAYTFARYRFPGSGILFTLIIILMMVLKKKICGSISTLNSLKFKSYHTPMILVHPTMHLG